MYAGVHRIAFIVCFSDLRMRRSACGEVEIESHVVKLAYTYM